MGELSIWDGSNKSFQVESPPHYSQGGNRTIKLSGMMAPPGATIIYLQPFGKAVLNIEVPDDMFVKLIGLERYQGFHFVAKKFKDNIQTGDFLGHICASPSDKSVLKHKIEEIESFCSSNYIQVTKCFRRIKYLLCTCHIICGYFRDYILSVGSLSKVSTYEYYKTSLKSLFKISPEFVPLFEFLLEELHKIKFCCHDIIYASSFAEENHLNSDIGKGFTYKNLYSRGKCSTTNYEKDILKMEDSPKSSSSTILSKSLKGSSKEKMDNIKSMNWEELAKYVSRLQDFFRRENTTNQILMISVVVIIVIILAVVARFVSGGKLNLPEF